MIATLTGLSEVSELQLLRSVFDCAPRGISVIDLNGRWLRLNEAYRRMLGFEPGELDGKSFYDLTHPADAAGDRAFVASALGTR